MKGFVGNDEFKKYPELEKRITLFTQTKGNRLNTNSAGKQATTIYYYYLMKSLGEGKTYGAAARMADENVKSYTSNDPEAFIGGQKLAATKLEGRDDLKKVA